MGTRPRSPRCSGAAKWRTSRWAGRCWIKYWPWWGTARRSSSPRGRKGGFSQWYLHPRKNSGMGCERRKENGHGRAETEDAQRGEEAVPEDGDREAHALSRLQTAHSDQQEAEPQAQAQQADARGAGDVYRIAALLPHR